MSVILLFLRSGGWKIVAGVVLALALIGGLWKFHHAAYQAGHDDAAKVYEARIAEQANRAAQAVTEANAKALIAERNAQTRIDAVSTMYEKEMDDANAKHAAVVASITRGTGRLRVDLAPSSRCSGGVPKVATGTASGDASGTGELSEVASQRLIELATRADLVAMKLRACQQIVQSDREEINGAAGAP